MRNADEVLSYLSTSNIGSMTMNKHVPFIWRVNYRNEPRSPETVLENAHEKAKKYLQKYLRR